MKNIEKRARKKVNTEQNRENAKSNKKGKEIRENNTKTNNTKINITGKIQRFLRLVANGEIADGFLFPVACL